MKILIRLWFVAFLLPTIFHKSDIKNNRKSCHVTAVAPALKPPPRGRLKNNNFAIKFAHATAVDKLREHNELFSRLYRAYTDTFIITFTWFFFYLCILINFH